MTEQELTALATYWVDRPRKQKLGLTDGHIAVDLSEGYLAIRAERDALKAELEATGINLDNAIGALRDIYKLRGIQP